MDFVPYRPRCTPSQLRGVQLLFLPLWVRVRPLVEKENEKGEGTTTAKGGLPSASHLTPHRPRMNDELPAHELASSKDVEPQVSKEKGEEGPLRFTSSLSHCRSASGGSTQEREPPDDHAWRDRSSSDTLQSEEVRAGTRSVDKTSYSPHPQQHPIRDVASINTPSSSFGPSSRSVGQECHPDTFTPPVFRPNSIPDRPPSLASSGRAVETAVGEGSTAAAKERSREECIKVSLWDAELYYEIHRVPRHHHRSADALHPTAAYPEREVVATRSHPDFTAEEGESGGEPRARQVDIQCRRVSFHSPHSDTPEEEQGVPSACHVVYRSAVRQREGHPCWPFPSPSVLSSSPRHDHSPLAPPSSLTATNDAETRSSSAANTTPVAEETTSASHVLSSTPSSALALWDRLFSSYHLVFYARLFYPNHHHHEDVSRRSPSPGGCDALLSGDVPHPHHHHHYSVTGSHGAAEVERNDAEEGAEKEKESGFVHSAPFYPSRRSEYATPRAMRTTDDWWTSTPRRSAVVLPSFGRAESCRMASESPEGLGSSASRTAPREAALPSSACAIPAAVDGDQEGGETPIPLLADAGVSSASPPPLNDRRTNSPACGCPQSGILPLWSFSLDPEDLRFLSHSPLKAAEALWKARKVTTTTTAGAGLHPRSASAGRPTTPAPWRKANEEVGAPRRPDAPARKTTRTPSRLPTSPLQSPAVSGPMPSAHLFTAEEHPPPCALMPRRRENGSEAPLATTGAEKTSSHHDAHSSGWISNKKKQRPEVLRGSLRDRSLSTVKGHADEAVMKSTPYHYVLVPPPEEGRLLAKDTAPPLAEVLLVYEGQLCVTSLRSCTATTAFPPCSGHVDEAQRQEVLFSHETDNTSPPGREFSPPQTLCCSSTPPCTSSMVTLQSCGGAAAAKSSVQRPLSSCGEDSDLTRFWCKCPGNWCAGVHVRSGSPHPRPLSASKRSAGPLCSGGGLETPADVLHPHHPTVEASRVQCRVSVLGGGTTSSTTHSLEPPSASSVLSTNALLAPHHRPLGVANGTTTTTTDALSSEASLTLSQARWMAMRSLWHRWWLDALAARREALVARTSFSLRQLVASPPSKGKGHPEVVCSTQKAGKKQHDGGESDASLSANTAAASRIERRETIELKQEKKPKKPKKPRHTRAALQREEAVMLAARLQAALHRQEQFRDAFHQLESGLDKVKAASQGRGPASSLQNGVESASALHSTALVAGDNGTLSRPSDETESRKTPTPARVSVESYGRVDWTERLQAYHAAQRQLDGSQRLLARQRQYLVAQLAEQYFPLVLSTHYGILPRQATRRSAKDCIRDTALPCMPTWTTLSVLFPASSSSHPHIPSASTTNSAAACALGTSEQQQGTSSSLPSPRTTTKPTGATSTSRHPSAAGGPILSGWHSSLYFPRTLEERREEAVAIASLCHAVLLLAAVHHLVLPYPIVMAGASTAILTRPERVAVALPPPVPVRGADRTTTTPSAASASATRSMLLSAAEMSRLGPLFLSGPPGKASEAALVQSDSYYTPVLPTPSESLGSVTFNSHNSNSSEVQGRTGLATTTVTAGGGENVGMPVDADPKLLVMVARMFLLEDVWALCRAIGVPHAEARETRFGALLHRLLRAASGGSSYS